MPAPARAGCAARRTSPCSTRGVPSSEPVARLTSGAFSPTLEGGIALAYLPADLASPARASPSTSAAARCPPRWCRGRSTSVRPETSAARGNAWRFLRNYATHPRTSGCASSRTAGDGRHHRLRAGPARRHRLRRAARGRPSDRAGRGLRRGRVGEGRVGPLHAREWRGDRAQRGAGASPPSW